MRGLRTISVVTMLLLCACSRGSGEEVASLAATGSDVVSFRTGDGIELSGRVFASRHAEAGIVLAHGATVDQSSWFAFAAELGRRGYLVLTFNFRGYCPGGDAGCSDGSKDTNTRPTDLDAAIQEIRSFGIERLGLMGSSLGGSAVLAVAADEGDSLDLVVALSATDDDLRRISAPKLFMAGTADDRVAALAQRSSTRARSRRGWCSLTRPTMARRCSGEAKARRRAPRCSTGSSSISPSETARRLGRLDAAVAGVEAWLLPRFLHPPGNAGT
jgi:pimeloyl-ACP methyl ester carboxylesterase